ncbi:MAG: PrsW family glutamic-type intramembrane protease [Ktedonobacteraceae bacterium]
MSSEYRGPTPNPNDPNALNRRSASESWGDQWTMGTTGSMDEEDTQPHPIVRVPASPPSQVHNQSQPIQQPQQPIQQPQQPPEQDDWRQFSHREHVTGALPVYPSEAPLFRPAYSPQQGQGYPPNSPYPPYQGQGSIPPQQGYPGHPGFQGYPPNYAPGYPPQYPYGAYPGYNGYAAYPPPYGWQPAPPPRDGYRLTMVIISLVGSSLALIGGFIAVALMVLIVISKSINPTVSNLSDSQYFSSVLTFTAFALAGLVGGSLSLYHSIRGLLKKPSANFALPWFWVFLVLYLFVLGIGYALQVNGQAVTTPALTIFLIILASLFPALTLLSLGVRRLRFPPHWSTSWRRFTLALTSGATLGIGLALLLELGLLFLLTRGQSTTSLLCIDNPNAPGCGSFTTFNLIFIIVALVGPLVEETVKPLGVALFIGKVRGAAEAFTLGLAAGIGFAIVETMGYIGSGYQDWLSVALERTAASLLHGFGTAMVALGWYYFVHTKGPQRFWKAIGCWAYAVLQHMIWNGTAVIALLPGPTGTTINNWNLDLGFTSIPFVEVLNIIEAILILVFFIYMTGRLRRQNPSVPSSTMESKGQQLAAAQTVART